MCFAWRNVLKCLCVCFRAKKSKAANETPSHTQSQESPYEDTHTHTSSHLTMSNEAQKQLPTSRRLGFLHALLFRSSILFIIIILSESLFILLLFACAWRKEMDVDVDVWMWMWMCLRAKWMMYFWSPWN